MKVPSWSEDDLRRAVGVSITWAQVYRALGLKSDGGSSSLKIRAEVARLDLDTSHFLGRHCSKGRGPGRDVAKQRAAQKRWYEKNRQLYLDRNRRNVEEKRKRIAELKNVPCADCGGRYPSFVMDFDHREEESKAGNISAMAARWSWPRLTAEIGKCDIVCANCHRMRTARRAGWSEYISRYTHKPNAS